MRKFIIISALLLASASAQAGETRSLSLAGLPTVNTTAAATGAGLGFEAPKPIAQVSTRLAQAATTASDAAPVTVAPPAAPAAAPAPVAQAPATTQTTAPAATTTTTSAATTTTSTTTTATTTESKPKSTKKARRETDEHKALRIAAKYGVYW
jgi:hypothetical protein